MPQFSRSQTNIESEFSNPENPTVHNSISNSQLIKVGKVVSWKVFERLKLKKPNRKYVVLERWGQKKNVIPRLGTVQRYESRSKGSWLLFCSWKLVKRKNAQNLIFLFVTLVSLHSTVKGYIEPPGFRSRVEAYIHTMWCHLVRNFKEHNLLLSYCCFQMVQNTHFGRLNTATMTDANVRQIKNSSLSLLTNSLFVICSGNLLNCYELFFFGGGGGSCLL